MCRARPVKMLDRQEGTLRLATASAFVTVVSKHRINGLLFPTLVIGRILGLP